MHEKCIKIRHRQSSHPFNCQHKTLSGCGGDSASVWCLAGGLYCRTRGTHIFCVGEPIAEKGFIGIEEYLALLVVWLYTKESLLIHLVPWAEVTFLLKVENFTFFSEVPI